MPQVRHKKTLLNAPPSRRGWNHCTNKDGMTPNPWKLYHSTHYECKTKYKGGLSMFNEFDDFLLYLRKSRMDTDYAETSVEETLSRHKAILLEFAKNNKLHIAEILEEVVSGESLHSRPKMIRLLELANTGRYAGVICMDIERLSRGSSLESGYIMQVFQVNGFKIVTPGKIYDLRNESDEQFTDMRFMFSRYELKSITTRLVRGRNVSASEGKFMGSVSPYGYEIYKLQGEKGNSLKIVPEQADVVRMIYDWYVAGDGYNTIAHKLNDMHIPCKSGTRWVQHSVNSILDNEVYLGKIRWKREPTVRVMENGQMVKKRELSKDYLLFEGRHEPIITQEQWERVKQTQKGRQTSSVRRDRKPANPFANILVCEKCGYAIRRNTPSANQIKTRSYRPWYRCATKGCDCMISYCDILEERIVAAMKEWWQGIAITLSETTGSTDEAQRQLNIMSKQMQTLLDQQNNICGLLERGVYTEEMFLKRNKVLCDEIEELKVRIEEMEETCHNNMEFTEAQELFFPTTVHLLDCYDMMTVEERNRLWKLMMKKITYYRNPQNPDEIEIHLYPKLGRAISA